MLAFEPCPAGQVGVITSSGATIAMLHECRALETFLLQSPRQFCFPGRNEGIGTQARPSVVLCKLLEEVPIGVLITSCRINAGY